MDTEFGPMFPAMKTVTEHNEPWKDLEDENGNVIEEDPSQQTFEF